MGSSSGKSSARKLALIIAIPLLVVATTFTVNVIATNVEAGQIVRYGQLVPVDGKEMNVVVAGSGEETIVFIPGLGTAAPGLDFMPLVQELQSDYRVIVVEPFGTGLSDGTDTARTSENIAGELHEALKYLGVERFVLMAHSIGGIYALSYSSAYPDDLIAFVGIDNSVPDQVGAEDPLPADGEIEVLDAPHYLHHVVSKEIAQSKRAFLSDVAER